MSAPKIWLIAMPIVGLALVLSGMTVVRLFEDSLTRGLEEEKSYSRHAMEYHRTHPRERSGDLVLAVWSDADYIANLVSQQHPQSEWAKWSNTLTYLPNNLQARNGRPYCVLNSSTQILVIWFPPNQSEVCERSMASAALVLGVRPGDLNFSGRTGYWVYLFRK